MALAELFAVGLVVAVCTSLMAGYPVALTLGGVSLACAMLGHLLGLMDVGILGALPQRIYGVITNQVLLAVPLFVFMGVMLERAGVAEDLLETMGRLFGPLRGGLGISAVIVGTLLAAALARLLLPNRFAGLLASRRKASDVLAFAVLGAAVLAVALSLP